MKMLKQTAMIGLLSLTFGVAKADPIHIDSSVFSGGGTTDLFSNIVFNIVATSLYNDVDNSGAIEAFSGDTATDIGQGSATALEVFGGGFLLDSQDGGFGTNWGLYTEYVLDPAPIVFNADLGGNGTTPLNGACEAGELCGLAANFTSGTFVLYADLLNGGGQDDVELFSLDVVSSFITAGLVTITGVVSNLTAAGGDSFFVNGLPFDTLDLIVGMIDTNVQFGPLTPCAPGDTSCDFTRVSELSADLVFVPEPATLGLIGLGLLGMGLRRKAKQA